MKKMKKLFAMLLTLAMVFGMSMTSFAAKNGATLKVNGLATNANQTVDIYEIYRLDENDNNWVAADWTNGTGVTPENLNTKTILSALKTKALTVTNTAVKKTATSSNGTVSFDGLQAGAYLVLVTDSSNKTTYSTMVAKTYKYDDNQLIAPLDETVVAKAETYHTDKDVDKATAEVGELVTYTVKTVVPYQSKDADGQSKVTEFKISDQLTNATLYLTGNAIKGVNPVNTFTLNGVSKDDLKLDATLNGKTAFELNLISLVTDDNTYAGQEVVITYTALVGKNNTINNKATSTQDSNGTTTYTYNGNATITKKDLEEKHTLKEAEVKHILSETYGTIRPCVEKLGSGPAHYMEIDGFEGKIGFISAISHKFCSGCNRVRMTADGFLKPCLQYETGMDLRTMLRDGVSDAELKAQIEMTITQKPKCHHFGEINEPEQTEHRGMSEIGG